MSGGADSLALLALGAAAGCAVTAVHVDHGQRPGAAVEANLVAAAAAEVGATFESHRMEVEPGPNLEERMRTARYLALGPEAATGHTMDDQAETVLLNLIRGAGLVGIGAMQPGPRRPILALRRADTEAVCHRLGWTPFTDPTNTDPAFTRNRLRREAMPLLAEIADRDIVPLLARSAANARDGADLVDALADSLDPTDARQLAAAPPAVAMRALQRWVRQASGEKHPVDRAGLQRALSVARGEIEATEVAGGLRIARSRQRLSITRVPGR